MNISLMVHGDSKVILITTKPRRHDVGTLSETNRENIEVMEQNLT